jgi:hypothetical protein
MFSTEAISFEAGHPAGSSEVSMVLNANFPLQVLADLGHEELKALGIAAYGDRHRLMKAIKIKMSSMFEVLVNR